MTKPLTWEMADDTLAKDPSTLADLETMLPKFNNGCSRQMRKETVG